MQFMDKSIITRELQILLEAINEQFEIIREYKDFIPQIEFDMIMENVRKLYETFHRLQRLNDPLLFVEKKISMPQEPVTSIPDQPERAPEPDVTRAVSMKPIIKKETQSRRPAKTAELELFASEEPVFNIKLKEAREKSLGPKVSRHESFKSAIGINDKFAFINELFDGNLREYNENIETLGGFKTLPQAQEYLDLLRRRYNWNSASDAFKRIKELVEKQY